MLKTERMNKGISQLTGVGLNGFPGARRDSPSAEAMLAGVLRASPAGIGCLADNIVTEANPQLCEMTGHSPEELVGFPFARLFAEAGEFDRVQTRLREQLASEPVACLETSWLRADGKVLEVRLTVTPLATGDTNQDWMFMALKADHPGTKRLEARLLRAQRLESIGTLAGGLAHDLNNVLAPILMSVHLLKEEAVNDSMRTCLDMLETCAQRGSEIITQVLTLSRGTEGARMPVHPKHLLKDIQRIVSETFPRAIRLANQVSKETPLIECDATQMQQLLMNLCLNASDAMPRGGTLTFGAERAILGPEAGALHPRAQFGTYAVLSVADTGPGIRPEVMEKMFDPCFTTKQQGQGTGQGLPAVKGIAENHGGFVQVESKLGKGTTFRVYLPAASNEHQRIVGPSDSLELPQGNGETVLVVDDEPAIRRIVEVILTKNGYRPLVAADGREAVTLFQRNKERIELMVSDLMMPHQDGLTTIRAIRGCKPALRVVAITGLDEETHIAEAKAAGAESFLKKPFTAHQLLMALKGLRENQRT